MENCESFRGFGYIHIYIYIIVTIIIMKIKILKNEEGFTKKFTYLSLGYFKMA